MKRIEHMMDINENLFQINREINDLREKIATESHVDYESQDARHVALDSIQGEMLSCRLWITTLNSLANKYTDDGKFKEKGFLRALGSPLNVKETETLMLDKLRLGFVVLVHFKIDNLFRNLLRELGETPKRIGYWNLCDRLLTTISVPNKQDKMDLLVLFSYLRNSLHNNGIHSGRSLFKSMSGLNYSFVKDEIVKCASWDHIIEALAANVELLSEILLSKRIKALDYEIKDQYASSINSS